MSTIETSGNLGREDCLEPISKRALDESFVVPVMSEELSVEKRMVPTGIVRIHKVVHQKEHLVEGPLKTTQVEVERIAVNRIVDGPIPVRYEGETAIYSVIEEVLVITKQFVLKEELRVTNRISESHDRQLVTLRTEELVVEREAVVEPSKF